MRIAVILTLVLGTAGLRVMHLTTTHTHADHSISGENLCEHDHGCAEHLDSSHDADHDENRHENAHNEVDKKTKSSHNDEQSCDTCVALLALAFQTTNTPLLVLTERICETVVVTTVVAPADCSLSANRARPPPIASFGV